MSIKSTLIDIGVLLFVAAIGVGVGSVRGYASGIQSQNSKILASQQDAQTAKDNATKANTALTQIRAQLAIQKQELEDAQKVAKAALDQRDQLVSQIIKATAARKAAERKLANETPACSDLQHLPICPELARRLFGQPVQTQLRTAAGTDDGH